MNYTDDRYHNHGVELLAILYRVHGRACGGKERGVEQEASDDKEGKKGEERCYIACVGHRAERCAKHHIVSCHHLGREYRRDEELRCREYE